MNRRFVKWFKVNQVNTQSGKHRKSKQVLGMEWNLMWEHRNRKAKKTAKSFVSKKTENKTKQTHIIEKKKMYLSLATLASSLDR